MDGDVFNSELFPNSNDIERIKQLGLADEQGNISDNYYSLQKTYQRLVELYLSKRTHVQEYEKHMSDGPVKFDELAENKKDIYQTDSLYRFFYLRNTFYVERLSEAGIEFLSKYEQLPEEINEEEMDFVIKTIKFLIRNINGEGISISYGPTAPEYLGPSNGIVIGVRYEIYPDVNTPEEDNIWFENYKKQLLVIEQLKDELSEEVESKTLIPTVVIQYNDSSTIPHKKKQDQYRLT